MTRWSDYQRQTIGWDDLYHVDDNKELAALVTKLDEDNEAVICIWAAQNKHDVAGY